MSNNTPPLEVETVLPFIGRSGDFRKRQVQLFATVRPDGGSFTPEVRLPQGSWQATPQPSGKRNSELDASLLGPRLWHLRLAGVATIRNAGMDPVNPRDPSGDTLEAGVQRGGSGWYKAIVALSTNVGFKEFSMDIGEDIEFYGTGANIVGLIGPPDTQLVTPQNQDTLSATGLVVDARIGCDIAAIEVATGKRSVRFTQHVSIAANGRADIDVPRFAKSVTIYQTSAAAASGPWTRQVGAGGSGIELGTIDFDGRTSRLHDRPIGDETVLRSDVDALNARFFTLVWEITP